MEAWTSGLRESMKTETEKKIMEKKKKRKSLRVQRDQSNGRNF